MREAIDESGFSAIGHRIPLRYDKATSQSRSGDLVATTQTTVAQIMARVRARIERHGWLNRRSSMSYSVTGRHCIAFYFHRWRYCVEKTQALVTTLPHKKYPASSNCNKKSLTCFIDLSLAIEVTSTNVKENKLSLLENIFTYQLFFRYEVVKYFIVLLQIQQNLIYILIIPWMSWIT